MKETISAGPDAAETRARAEQVRNDLLEKVRVGNHPRSDATVDQLWEAHCEKTKWGRKTRDTNAGYYRKHIQPFLGQYKINNGRLDGDLIDEFYAELERCRDHCTGSRSAPPVRHWSASEHRCDQRCKPHTCRPLAAWTIRKIHSMLNGAFSYARRKKWTLRNPMEGAEPSSPKGCPQPPTVKEAALIIDAAWNGTYYGPAVWFATTTGARLGELCALRWRDLTIPARGHLPRHRRARPPRLSRTGLSLGAVDQPQHRAGRLGGMGEGHQDPVPTANVVRAGQAAWWYSLRIPPSRCRRRMSRWVSAA